VVAGGFLRRAVQRWDDWGTVSESLGCNLF